MVLKINGAIQKDLIKIIDSDKLEEGKSRINYIVSTLVKIIDKYGFNNIVIIIIKKGD